MLDVIANSSTGTVLDLIYSLAVPMETLRRRFERQALIHEIANVPRDAVRLKVKNFGDDATGWKTAAYFETCQDFHDLEIPVVGDHVGGLPGLGALAFGAIGGIAHGVTTLQSFRPTNWSGTRTSPRGGPVRRIHLPQLDMMIKPRATRLLLEESARKRAGFACPYTECFPHGLENMIGRPARHAIFQRAREIEWLPSTPQRVHVDRHLEERVRPASNDVAVIAGLNGLDEPLKARLIKKQSELSRFRQTMVHLANTASSGTTAIPSHTEPHRHRQNAEGEFPRIQGVEK